MARPVKYEPHPNHPPNPHIAAGAELAELLGLEEKVTADAITYSDAAKYIAKILHEGEPAAERVGEVVAHLEIKDAEVEARFRAAFTEVATHVDEAKAPS